jgi:hypothetical protein
MPDDLVTKEGVDEAPEPTEQKDPAAPAGILPDEPPASPDPTDVPRPPEPGQQVEEGEG